MQWTPKGFLTTQFDHGDVEAIGLPKLDLLGIRALTVLDHATQLVRQHHDPGFQLDQIPLDDNATAENLASGNTVGIFQCESSGAQRTLRQLRAQTIRDLAVANAFFKPGPATGGMAAAFVRRYRGQEESNFLHPSLTAILGSTHGVLLFQEQILRVATEIAGLSWAEADHLRRGMSKFKPTEMEQMRARFIEGCQLKKAGRDKFSAQQAQTLWEQILAFAGYGFNQGHATAYADVSYRSAFMKSHWPAAFMAARLANYGGFYQPAIYIAEAITLGIPVRPPHINQSERHFTLTFASDMAEAPEWTQASAEELSSLTSSECRPDTEQRAISPILWMGLGQIRDLRRKSISTIIEERRQKPFQNLNDLLTRVSLQPKEIMHLIQVGALDGFGSSRAAQLDQSQGQNSGKGTFQLTFDFVHPSVESESPEERLQWEQHLLGQSLSVHPLDLVEIEQQSVTPLHELPKHKGDSVTIACIRIPGYTGGKGFFVGDHKSYITVRAHQSLKPPKPWQPVLITGHWVVDEWGTGWLQAVDCQSIL